MDLAPDFDEFIECLTVHGVEFVIVGAYALAFHGAPRFTGDLDVLFHPSTANATRLLEAIRAFGFPVDMRAEDLMEPRQMLEMGLPPVQLHVMSAISGVTWEEAAREAVHGRLGRHDVAFLGRDTLVRNKRAAGRPKDLADLDALEPGDDR